MEENGGTRDAAFGCCRRNFLGVPMKHTKLPGLETLRNEADCAVLLCDN